MSTSQSVNLKPVFQRMGSIGFSKMSQLTSFLASIWQKSNVAMQKAMLNLAVETKRWGKEMIKAINKGVEAAELTRPPAGVFGDVDLRVIPKYVSYQAALVREKLGMQFLLGLVALLWIGTFLVQTNRIDYWQTKYREKEFILVPSNIVGHTPAVPQDVPKSYVGNAASYFIELLGNTTPSDIDEHYDRFASYMSPDLKGKFLSETARWRATAKTEGIYEQIEITQKVWTPDGKGGFDVTISLRRDRRVSGEFMGSTPEIVKMKLQLVPPQREREWIFEIREFSRRPANIHG